MSVQVQSFFHRDSNTFSYLVSDPASGEAALIDPVLDYDPDTDASSESPLRDLLQAIEQQGLQLRWLLETHAHADHVSAGRRLKQRFPQAALAIGEGIRAVQATFAPRYGLQLPAADDIFDRLFADGETFALGELQARVIAVPGHTSDSVAYLIGDALFSGDSLFMPDGGTARCDFPGGDAAQLYRSIQRLLALPDATRVFVCHDYGPGGRAFANETTIGEQRAHNIHVHDGVAEAEFVSVRQARDATLAEPALMQPAVKANIQGGA
ncbi:MULTISPECIES: MBL fold metallo-hydrolase [Stenotrophomonas]|uniref:MBL fold metallo-hydrolase n=1 Tax=Stenotrophomonas TaxID=40323 RepID=UPI00201D1012|nr:MULTISPECIES: MBL fold metallo-hydrolase [Stenotrophomonas]MDH1275039.1 MBL fold metallo-hydrolase [Stenotrophomonas sp. GD03937]UQY95326.1 MBL fold metallo-hydrolase [Stenotrophomonas maltophilia]